MRITNQLPQFNNVRHLLAVTGQQDADFYLATNGTIDKIYSFEEASPIYTDREGFFAIRGNGKTYSTGAVYEAKKQYSIKQFQKKFSEKLKRIVLDNKVGEISLFAPHHTLRQTQSSVPAGIKSRVKFSFAGNYNREHPFEIIAKLKERGYEQTLHGERPMNLQIQDKILNRIQRIKRKSVKLQKP